MVVGIQTMILNNKQRQKQQGSPNWWWLDAARNNNNNNGDATQRSSPWLRSALSELDETTTAMLKLIEADADSFAQRAEMYYNKRPELIGVVEEFYRMHRSLATRFDQLKSDSATRLLMTLGSPFSCNGQVPLGKSFSLSPGVYKNYDAHSDISDDHEDNPESEVEDPEDDSGTEATSPKEEFRGKPVALDEEVLTRADGSDEIQMLKEEVERLKEENKTLRDEMAQKDSESKEALGRLSMSMYEIARIKEENKIQRDEMARQEEQKVDMIRELTVSMDEKKRLKEQNNENKREGTRPLRAASTDVPKENGPSQKKVKPALPNLGKAGNPIDSETTQGGNFLRRLFPKSSKKSKVTNALSFGTLSLGF